MENIKEVLQTLIQTNGFQFCSVILTLAFAVLRVIASSSIGKRALNDLTIKHNNSVKKFAEMKETYDNYVAKKEEEFKQLTSQYEAKINALLTYSNENLKKIKEALSKINNEQVKEIISSLDFKFPENISISEEIEKAKEQVKNEYEEKIKEIVLEVMNNGKDKETVDNNSREE